MSANLKAMGRNSSNQPRSKLWNMGETASLVALAVVFITLTGMTLYQRYTSTGPYRVEYEGRVVDKSITIGESELGSYPVRRLHIRERSGKEFGVIVNATLYERVQIGMWIKSSSSGAEVSWEERR